MYITPTFFSSLNTDGINSAKAAFGISASSNID